MKNILNVIVDMLTLLALCLAAIGHVLPWFDRNRILNLPPMGRAQGVPPLDLQALTDFQQWHALRSGAALASVAVLVCLSLVIHWGPVMRRVLNLGMFASAFTALLFELLIFSNYDLVGPQRLLHLYDTEGGYILAMVPTCFVLFFCLVRMIWTMPPSRPAVYAASPADLDRMPALELPPKQSGYTERRG